MKSTLNDKAQRLPTEMLNEKGKIIIPANVLAQINYACSRINKLEWSGVLFYDLQGEVSDPTSFVATCISIFPMDIGSTGFTDFKHNTPEFLTFMKENNLLRLKRGLIHSHHNMGTFFSGEDVDEMEINTATVSPYVSLIVNNKGEFTARASYKANISTTGVQVVRFSENGKSHSIQREVVIEKEVAVTFGLSVEYGYDLVGHIKQGFDNIITAQDLASKQKQAAKFVSPYTSNKVKPEPINLPDLFSTPDTSWHYPPTKWNNTFDDEEELEEVGINREQILAALIYEDVDTTLTLSQVLEIADLYFSPIETSQYVEDIIKMIDEVEAIFGVDLAEESFIAALNNYPGSDTAQLVKTVLKQYAANSEKDVTND